MGSEVLQHVNISCPTSIYTHVDGRRLRPLEVGECTVEIIAKFELETGPERWAGYEAITPVPTDLRGYDQIALVGAMFENSRQDLWRKPVDWDKCVPDRRNRLRNLGEFTFDVIEL